MKTFFFLFVVCALSASAAAGQSIGATLSGEAHPLIVSGHPQHASQAGLSTGQNLMERSGSTSAHGERPLWEVMPLTPETPLGDSARALRKEHAAAKKAIAVWKN
jgi:hypothetical protein